MARVTSPMGGHRRKVSEREKMRFAAEQAEKDRAAKAKAGEAREETAQQPTRARVGLAVGSRLGGDPAAAIKMISGRTSPAEKREPRPGPYQRYIAGTRTPEAAARAERVRRAGAERKQRYIGAEKRGEIPGYGERLAKMRKGGLTDPTGIRGLQYLEKETSAQAYRRENEATGVAVGPPGKTAEDYRKGGYLAYPGESPAQLEERSAGLREQRFVRQEPEVARASEFQEADRIGAQLERATDPAQVAALIPQLEAVLARIEATTPHLAVPPPAQGPVAPPQPVMTPGERGREDEAGRLFGYQADTARDTAAYLRGQPGAPTVAQPQPAPQPYAPQPVQPPPYQQERWSDWGPDTARYLAATGQIPARPDAQPMQQLPAAAAPQPAVAPPAGLGADTYRRLQGQIGGPALPGGRPAPGPAPALTEPGLVMSPQDQAILARPPVPPAERATPAHPFGGATPGERGQEADIDVSRAHAARIRRETEVMPGAGEPGDPRRVAALEALRETYEPVATSFKGDPGMYVSEADAREMKRTYHLIESQLTAESDPGEAARWLQRSEFLTKLDDAIANAGWAEKTSWGGVAVGMPLVSGAAKRWGPSFKSFRERGEWATKLRDLINKTAGQRKATPAARAAPTSPLSSGRTPPGAAR